jgi:hypothetical protein
MNTENKSEENKKSPTGVEHDYEAHKENNPAPSKEAVFEKDEKGAGQAMKWIIPILIVLLFITYFIIKD